MATRMSERLSAGEQAGLTAYVDHLWRSYGDNLLRVVLFGSKARGDANEESDLDLFVVLRMESGDYRRHWNELVDLAWEIQLTHGIIISFILKDEPSYLKMRRDGLLLARNIDKDGIDLWTTQPSAPTYAPA